MRNTTSELRKTSQQLDAANHALQLKASEYNTHKETLLDAARGGRLLAARDEAIEALKEEYESSEQENIDLKQQVITLRQQSLDFQNVMEKQQAKLDQIAAELLSCGEGKEHLAVEYQRALEELAACKTENDTLASHVEATTNIETQLRDAILYKTVLETQLSDARELIETLQTEVSPKHQQETSIHMNNLHITIDQLQSKLELLTNEKSEMSDRHQIEANLLRTSLENAESEAARDAEILGEKLTAALKKLEEQEQNKMDWERLQNENSFLKETIEELKQTNAAVNTELQGYRNDLDSREAELQRMHLINSASRSVSVRRSGGSRSSTPLPIPPPTPSSDSTINTTVASAFMMATTPPAASRHPLPGLPNTSQNTTGISLTVSEPSPSPVVRNKRMATLEDIAYGVSPGR
eukprot:TRINITY_DN8686_c0_g1_i2.p1 TRINITY_DN8686_c0_g1~~TRINITY_DN8686_c0_g1_i2.p1  ORF type:complete len:411 (+),score=78.21 TRINITY_DN8686_c0_g1_i2:375-1607(+)